MSRTKAGVGRKRTITVPNASDALTNSFLAQQVQQQTASIISAHNATTDAVNAMRRELQQLTRAMAS